ncbi:RidA family protein [Salinisphaera hydrothermalis]|uniref:RidA family protein n=1 Tax=Salinisphaera hydrothermalis TaxID=563188 RepID=UPI0033411F67
MATFRGLVMAGDNDITWVQTDKAPAPGGHYAQAVRAGDTLYISGQLPIPPAGGTPAGPDFDDQARLALDNLLAVLAAAGGEARHLTKVTIYIVDIANWPRFNDIYSERLAPACPARSVVPVPELHHGYRVEIDAVAYLPIAPNAPIER